MNEGLSFEPVPEPPEQNRLFIIIAIGLVGMLVLGLLGIGGYVIFSRSKRPTQRVAQQSTAIVLLATDTPTVMATDTPLPTKTATPLWTNTPVVLLGSSTPAVVVLQPTTTALSGFFGAGTTTPEVVVIPGTSPQMTQVVVIENPTATPPSAPQQATSTPNTGFGLGAIGLGAGLAFVVFMTRRLRLG
jgi:hypothetical protein